MKKQEEPITIKKVVNNLLIIVIVTLVTFLGISFISGAPELTDKFLVYFGIFLVTVELIAIAVWPVSRLFKSKKE